MNKRNNVSTFFSLIGIFLITYGNALFADCFGDIKCIPHNIQLQLSDADGFPVPDTQFWVTLNIVQDGPRVTVYVPEINFQTGQKSNNNNNRALSTFVNGGYLYTSDGFLPPELRPNDLVPRSIVAPSNNGLSSMFSFSQTATSLPVPPAGYLVQVTQAGALQVQGAKEFGNVISPGAQTLLPCAITYLVQSDERVRRNYVLSTGATDITGFTLEFFADHGFRDSHVNDVFDNLVVWAWADNSNIVDKTNNTLNTMVVIGQTNRDGTLTFGQPIQLTNLQPNQMVWDTAVAINRRNKNNIVVSWQLIDGTIPSPEPKGTPQRIPWRAVTFDGGVTWDTAPVLNIIEPRAGAIYTGDCRGVSSDKFGHIWYSTTQFFDSAFNTINQPLFAVSMDGGLTFTVAFTAPPIVNPGELYDYPQYCFGGFGDQANTYGLWYTADFFNVAEDVIPVVGFVSINQDVIGTGTTAFLPKLLNTQLLPSITAALDGRVWAEALTENATTYISPVVNRFKSPGALAANYAGPWDQGFVNRIDTHLLANQISFPKRGYIPTATQSNIYDEERQVLYSMYAMQVPDNSQNMQIVLSISRNNGETWSDPIQIATTDFANRGYQSMALDPVTGNLVFGWYDGRNDTSFKSVEYFAAVIPAAKLSRLVDSIPLTDPVVVVPPAN